MTHKLTKKGAQTVRETLMKHQDQFRQALGRSIDLDYFFRVIMTTIREQPKLLECSEASLFRALIHAAQLRLMPDGIMGQAYLVPYKGVASLIPGYKGLIELARRTGTVRSLRPRVVREDDHFEFEYGFKDSIIHRPNLKADSPLIAVYAIVDFTDGGHQIEIMSREQCEKIRNRTPNINREDAPWKIHFEQMCLKTVIRRLVKWLPLSINDQRLIQNEERIESGLDLTTPELEDSTVEILDPPPKSPPKSPPKGVSGMKDVLAKNEEQSKNDLDLKTFISDELMNRKKKPAERVGLLKTWVQEKYGFERAEKIQSVDDLETQEASAIAHSLADKVSQ